MRLEFDEEPENIEGERLVRTRLGDEPPSGASSGPANALQIGGPHAQIDILNRALARIRVEERPRQDALHWQNIDAGFLAAGQNALER